MLSVHYEAHRATILRCCFEVELEKTSILIIQVAIFILCTAFRKYRPIYERMISSFVFITVLIDNYCY